uniref:Uncharacterized protein n=1 Tax=Zea mays TaxID=4577 RepID=C0PCA4_MAIZE|nr:unknown [Zea mays]
MSRRGRGERMSPRGLGESISRRGRGHRMSRRGRSATTTYLPPTSRSVRSAASDPHRSRLDITTIWTSAPGATPKSSSARYVAMIWECRLRPAHIEARPYSRLVRLPAAYYLATVAFRYASILAGSIFANCKRCSVL